MNDFSHSAHLMRLRVEGVSMCLVKMDNEPNDLPHFRHANSASVP